MAKREEAGTIYKIGEITIFKGKDEKEYRSRDLIIEQHYESPYGERFNYVKMTVADKLCDQVGGFHFGDNVIFEYYIQGIKYNKKDKEGNKTDEEDVFMKLNLAKIAPKGQYRAEFTTTGSQIAEIDQMEEPEKDDLPF